MRARILRVLAHDFTVVIKRYVPRADQHLVEFAYEMACFAHKDQAPRLSGQSYITHPESVAKTMIAAGVRDAGYICLALLHDVFEDCASLTREHVESIRAVLGNEMVSDMHAITKRYANPALRPMDRASDLDYYQVLRHASRRVQITKFYDRLNNMSDINERHISVGKRERTKHTTRFIFLPMARAMLDAMNRVDKQRHIVQFAHDEFDRLCRG